MNWKCLFKGHDWECINENMFSVHAGNVRFKCKRCGQVEGLLGRPRSIVVFLILLVLFFSFTLGGCAEREPPKYISSCVESQAQMVYQCMGGNVAGMGGIATGGGCGYFLRPVCTKHINIINPDWEVWNEQKLENRP